MRWRITPLSVGENFNAPGFIEDILQVAPATKNIAVVIGASPVEQYWTAAFRKEFEPFANRINFIWLNDLSFDQMLEKTRTLPPDSYIFLILLLRDAMGVTHNADEALQRIHAVANAPINSIYQHQLGLGIVGGRLYQAEREGIESAHIAVRILHGEPASSFPPKIVGPLSPRYDWRELKRWKINEKRLATRQRGLVPRTDGLGTIRGVDHSRGLALFCASGSHLWVARESGKTPARRTLLDQK